VRGAGQGLLPLDVALQTLVSVRGGEEGHRRTLPAAATRALLREAEHGGVLPGECHAGPDGHLLYLLRQRTGGACLDRGPTRPAPLYLGHHLAKGWARHHL
jgi:hypothetical protein